MKFSDAITKLYESSSPHSMYSVMIRSDSEFSDVNLLDPNQSVIDPGVLYFADATALKADTPIPICLVYYGKMPKDVEPRLINSVQIEQKDLACMFHAIKSMLINDDSDGEMYSDVLYMFLSGTDLDTILTRMTERTGDLFAVIDSTGKLIAKTKNFYVNYSVWMNSIEQGYCNDILMGYIEDIRKKNNYSLSTVPFSLFCQHLQMYILCNRIVFNNFLMGYVFIISKSGVFSACEQKLIPLLANSVRDIVMKYDGGKRRDYKTTQLGNILHDIISGAHAEDMDRRLNFAHISFPKQMRLLVLNPVYFREAHYFDSTLIPDFTKIFGPCPVTVYNNQMVAIVGVDESLEIPSDQLEAFKGYAQENRIRTGVSNSFSKVQEIRDSYGQCLQVLHFARQITTDEKVLYFSDYVYYALFDQVNDTGLFSCIRHPALDMLRHYDSEKGANLYQTLKIFTKTGFNKIKTAELMFLHRNTVNYRIQQIESLCNIDLTRTDLLFPLQISFLVDSYLDNQPA